MSTGYLVVLKSTKQIMQSYNPRYRGLFRTRPFYIKEYERGFDDPYFSGKYTNEHGLIANLHSAREALEQLGNVEDRNAFEIIYARTVDDSSRADIKGLRFLGFDVACYAPFWSIVVDSPSPADPLFQRLLERLNEYGLFGSEEDAREYLKSYRSVNPKSESLTLNIWGVYLVI